MLLLNSLNFINNYYFTKKLFMKIFNLWYLTSFLDNCEIHKTKENCINWSTYILGSHWIVLELQGLFIYQKKEVKSNGVGIKIGMYCLLQKFCIQYPLFVALLSVQSLDSCIWLSYSLILFLSLPYSFPLSHFLSLFSYLSLFLSPSS